MLGILHLTVFLLGAQAGPAVAAETSWEDVTDDTPLREAFERPVRFLFSATLTGVCPNGGPIEATFINGTWHRGASAARNTREYSCVLSTAGNVHQDLGRLAFTVRKVDWRPTGESLPATANASPQSPASRRYGAGFAEFQPRALASEPVPICKFSLADVSATYLMSCRVNCAATVGDLRAIFGPADEITLETPIEN